MLVGKRATEPLLPYPRDERVQASEAKSGREFGDRTLLCLHKPARQPTEVADSSIGVARFTHAAGIGDRNSRKRRRSAVAAIQDTLSCQARAPAWPWGS